MTDTVVEGSVWPVNELGEIVAASGSGSSNVAGWLPLSFIPHNIGGKLPVVGLASTSPYEVDIKEKYGAKCDAVRTFGGGSITSGSNVFLDASGIFTAADIGKLFYIAGAGVGGTLLETTISSFVSTTSVTLAANASTTVAGAHYLYGSDDTAAWVNAVSAVQNGAITTIRIPFGLSLTDGFALKSNTSIIGCQPDGWAFRNLKRVSGLVLKPKSAKPALIYGINPSVGNVQLEKLYLDGVARFQGNTVVRYSGAATTAASNIVNFTNGTFTAADIGKKIIIYGAGVGGTLQDAGYTGFITAVNTVNQVVIDDSTHPSPINTSDVAYAYGFSDLQGVDGTTTAASNIFNAVSGTFTAADVGKIIHIYECMIPEWGDGTLNKGDKLGELLVTHITAVNSPTQVVLHTAPTLTTTSKRWFVGSQSAVYQPSSTISQDSMWHMNRIVGCNFAGNGYTVGLYQRAQRLDQVYWWQCMAHGMYLGSGDNTFIANIWAECGEDGFYATGGTNHFFGGDTFNNEGNGAYLGGYAGQSHLYSVMFDTNGRNGLLDFSSGSQKFGCRFTTNSQCKNGQYSDYSVAARYFGGVSNLNTYGNGLHGAFSTLFAPFGNKPQYGIYAVGPYTIHGNGMLFNPATSPWVSGPVVSGNITSVHQHSFAMEGGTSLYMNGNNTLRGSTTLPTKIGNATNELWGFYGSSGTVQPSGAGQAVATDLTSVVTLANSLRTALVSLGLIKGSA